MPGLKDKYAIVGIGMTEISRNSGRTTRTLGVEALRSAMQDAGLGPDDVDGMLSYHGNDSTGSPTIAGDLGIRLNFYMDCSGGGSSTEALIGIAIGVIEAGMCNTVAIFRAMNGYTEARIGGTGRQAPVFRGDSVTAGIHGMTSAGQSFAPSFMRHMYEYGTTQEQFAKCAVDERFNALENPNAVWQGQPITIDDVLNSRFTNDPLHLLESVMPCSGGAAVVVTSAERARSMPHPPAYVLGAGGPATSHDTIWQEDRIATTPVVMTAPNALQMAEVNINEIQFAEFYDCYTILVMACLEDAGICAKGDIGAFYESTDTTYKGEFPINTDGGQIAAGQPGGSAGGFRHIVEATRQVMGRAENRQVEKSDLCLVNG